MILKEYNSPDGVYDEMSEENLDMWDRDAIAFYYHPDYGFMAEPNGVHQNMLRALALYIMGYEDEADYKRRLTQANSNSEFFRLDSELKYTVQGLNNDGAVMGRYWCERGVISFWDGIPDLQTFKIIVKKLHVSFDEIRIALEEEIMLAKDVYQSKSICDGNGIPFDAEMQADAKALHLMNASDKVQTYQMQNYLHNRAENQGKKLQYQNKTEEMPMAQWRALHTTSENTEKDKYVIGAEEDGALGNFHLTENRQFIDIDKVNTIVYYVCEVEDENYDDDDDNNETSTHFEYDIELYDINDNLLYSIDRLIFDEVWDLLGQELAVKISNGEGYTKDNYCYRIEDLLYCNIDDSNVNEVNAQSKKMFEYSDSYVGGDRGYILTDGIILEFGPNIDHASISRVGNQTIGSFLSLGNIRIGENSIELACEPTYEQKQQIRRMINHYSDDVLYVDIIQYQGSGMYGNTVTSATYHHPNYNKVMGEINRYFDEGINLRGGYCDDDYMFENVQYEVEPHEVDLSTFKKQSELNKQIWKNNKTIDSRVRLQLLDIADDFFDSLEVSFVEPIDIILRGSICNYNWSTASDIDLHIVLDFNEIGKYKDLIKDYFDTKKNEWNKNHKGLEIFGFPVELYVEDINEYNVSNGVYSLEKNKWIKEPNKNEVKSIEPESEEIQELAAQLMTCIDDLIGEFHQSELDTQFEEIQDTLEYIWSFIKAMRKQSLNNEGEYSKGNIIYKILRRNGYLEEILQLRNDIYNKLNSIS